MLRTNINLQPIPAPATAPAPSPSSKAAIVAPAVIVPVVVLFALIAAMVLYKRKRDEEKKSGTFDPLVSGSSDLDAPLAAEDAGSRASSLGGASAECLGGPDHVPSHEIVERTASDIQVRLASTTSNRA